MPGAGAAVLLAVVVVVVLEEGFKYEDEYRLAGADGERVGSEDNDGNGRVEETDDEVEAGATGGLVEAGAAAAV